MPKDNGVVVVAVDRISENQFAVPPDTSHAQISPGPGETWAFDGADVPEEMYGILADSDPMSWENLGFQ